ncbi:MAG: UDP-N-acetylmuramoyl-L-alanyl-D-glutamate--2,6-diaminopimelate ligase [Clostridiales bacterium]|nr:UDP-N-acetylmuramoyl-L-alanyl-D-glutamate--2,6-diaminopimelate ligase [Clostridiales bacterium]
MAEGLPIELVRGDANTDVKEIVFDSRNAGAGTLFAALPGANDKSLDGHSFIPDAYGRGCRVFLVSSIPDSGLSDASILLTENTRRALALLSQRFFGDPAGRLKFVALTGTKGKTTISYMLRSIFEKAGKKVALIGSNGVMYPGFYKKLLNTTPESWVLHGFLKDMADAGVEYCFLEATSQGFMMHRTDGIVFDAALYTNISPDHISKTEHDSFEHYFACKKSIFDQCKICYVNRDAELFDDIVSGVPGELIRTYGFSHAQGGSAPCSSVHDGSAPGSSVHGGSAPGSFVHGGSAPDYAAEDVSLTRNKNRMSVEFICAAPSWRRKMRIDIPGRFNAENALGAICIADHFGIDKEHIAAGLADASCAGRMEHVDVPAPYTVLIDFAHNRLSMEAMMDTAKSYGPRRILCVFGLEGDRAHLRRFDSGEILGRDADYTILSDASPRTDDPDRILADIAEGIERGGGAGKYEIIRDRHVSIPKILGMAGEGDLVLLVGKGNVLYEEVFGELTPIDEREIVKGYFETGAGAGRKAVAR